MGDIRSIGLGPGVKEEKEVNLRGMESHLLFLKEDPLLHVEDLVDGGHDLGHKARVIQLAHDQCLATKL